MRTSRLILGLILVASAPVAALAQTSTTPFSTPREALRQGVSAYQGGYYEIAIPALENAAAAGEFMASYYLAKIYQDSTGSHTDHAKAYALFEKIADEHLDADPDADPRAPYVGKALTALAGYVLRGLPEIGLAPDPERAVFYLNNASSTFNDEDAQFELAKLQLKGEGVEANVPLGRYWLSNLSQNGHAGAQAFFADLLWRGKHVEPDPAQALALIAVAVANAPPEDAMWIKDIYQNIFCGSSQGTRKQADGIVAVWRKIFPRPAAPQERMGLGGHELQPQRACGDGELVDIQRVQAVAGSRPAPAAPPAALPAASPPRPEVMQGNAAGFGLRDAGATK